MSTSPEPTGSLASGQKSLEVSVELALKPLHPRLARRARARLVARLLGAAPITISAASLSFGEEVQAELAFTSGQRLRAAWTYHSPLPSARFAASIALTFSTPCCQAFIEFHARLKLDSWPELGRYVCSACEAEFRDGREYVGSLNPPSPERSLTRAGAQLEAFFAEALDPLEAGLYRYDAETFLVALIHAAAEPDALRRQALSKARGTGPRAGSNFRKGGDNRTL